MVNSEVTCCNFAIALAGKQYPHCRRFGASIPCIVDRTSKFNPRRSRQ